MIEIAEIWGYDATAAWVRTYREEYARLLFYGVKVGEEER